MDSFKAQFESDLRQKLSQRTTAHTSEENVMLRAFKYFDLDNSGSVTFSEWLKALEKLGIMLQDTQQLQQLFGCYDADNSGHLDYKEFSSSVLEGPQVSSRASTAVSLGQLQQGERVLEKLRKSLAARGGRGIIGLARQFKIMDDDNSRSLEFSEFFKAMHDFRVNLEETEARALFTLVDRNRSGTVDYDEFLRAVRGPMNSFRKVLVGKAFDKLDSDGSGVIELNDIRGVYNARGHPDVRSGKKTEDEILGEFLETFEMHHNIQGTRDQRVTRAEFEEYYNNVSSSVDNDQYFELMMNTAWKLAEPTPYAKNKSWTNKQEVKTLERAKAPAVLPLTVDRIFENFRKSVAARGARGMIGIQRQFRIMDDDQSGNISFAEFRKGCKDFRLELSDRDIQSLFSGLDRDQSGQIDIDELVRGIRGPMNSVRKALVLQAFKKLDRDGSGVLEVSDITGVYSAKSHPDVRSHKRTEAEVLGEFLETFETHHNLADPSKRDQAVTQEEFEEYYNNVSASIDDDRYFELMMNNAWHLTSDSPTKAAWKGDYSSAGFTLGQKRNFEQQVAPYGVTVGKGDWSTSNRQNAQKGSEHSLIGELRRKLASRGGARGFIGLARQFKIMDDDNSKHLEFAEFAKGMRDFRVDLSAGDLKKLFDLLDADGSGSIQYEEFIHRVRGEMNSFRVALVTRAFNKLDRSGDGTVELADLKGVYNGKQHPDVRSGKKTEDEVLVEFLDTFETHHATFKEDTRDHRVSLAEFLEYYGHVSASIDDDQYFELMMNKAWNFEGKKFETGWGGDYTAPAQRTK